MPRVPIEKRHRIANLIRLEIPYRRIAKMEGVHNTTVRRLKKKLEKQHCPGFAQVGPISSIYRKR